MLRVIFVLLFELVLSVAFAIAFAGVFLWWQGASIPQAFSVDAPHLILVFMDIGIGVFAILLLIGGIRRRGLGWSIGGTFLAALIGAIVNLVWIAILSAAAGGVDPAAMLLGVEAGVIFVIAATIATIGVRRIIRIPARKAPATPPADAAA
jgi:hypothetical protein